MLLADVIGTVVMTVKHPAYVGEKVLACQPLDEAGRPSGPVLFACDRAQAGVGDRVLLLRDGNGVRQIIGRDEGKPVDEAVKMDLPMRTLIVGIVDHVDVRETRDGNDRNDETTAGRRDAGGAPEARRL